MTTLEKKSHIEGVPEKKGGKKRVWKVKVRTFKKKKIPNANVNTRYIYFIQSVK